MPKRSNEDVGGPPLLPRGLALQLEFRRRSSAGTAKPTWIAANYLIEQVIDALSDHKFKILVGSSRAAGVENMTTCRNFVLTTCMTGLSLLAYAQNAPAPAPRRIAAVDARSHLGETVIICGKVTDTKISKYGLAGRGKPVTFDIDQPEPNPIFYFVTFGAEPEGPKEAVAAYQGKSVCVTGKISEAGTAGVPYIMAADRTQIKLQTAGK